MDVDEVWRHTHEQRRALAALLRDLSEEEWAVASLCEGWTVRDVAAHVMRSATVTPVEMAVALVRSRGRYNTLVAEDARRAARRPVAELVAQFDRHDGSRRRPFGTAVTDPLLDVLVHSQDIAVPLGRPTSDADRAGGGGRPSCPTAQLPLHRLRTTTPPRDSGDRRGLRRRRRPAGRGPHACGALAADRTHRRRSTWPERSRGRPPHLRNCSPSTSAGIPASPIALRHNRCSTATSTRPRARWAPTRNSTRPRPSPG